MTYGKPHTPATTSPTADAPIADLSYRPYDGPMYSRRFRWWTIALASVRLALRNRWYWVLCAGALLPYVFYGLVFYLWKSATSQSPMPPMRPPFLLSDAGGHEYAMLFFQAFQGFELLWLFGIALLVGAGSIASDNRANALQVYLARPITKSDYLTGKWAGIFVPVTLASLLPALALYAFLGLAFSTEGFFKNEPTLILRILLTGMLPGVIHASLLVGFSAWSGTARLAGAFYAGAYFLTSIVTRILWMALYGFHPEKGVLLQHLSIPGLLQGMSRNIFDVVVDRTLVGRRDQTIHLAQIHPPDPWLLLAIIAGLCLLAIAAARWRIRAVEVVRG